MSSADNVYGFKSFSSIHVVLPLHAEPLSNNNVLNFFDNLLFRISAFETIHTFCTRQVYIPGRDFLLCAQVQGYRDILGMVSLIYHSVSLFSPFHSAQLLIPDIAQFHPC